MREVPAVVVDDSHSSLSREYLRKVDATPDIQIVSYCADMEEAKQMLKNRRAYGIIYIPRISATILPKENRHKSVSIAI